LSNFTIQPFEFNATRLEAAEASIEGGRSKAAITSLHLYAAQRNTILYAGDSAGWLRIYNREGLIMKQLKPAADPNHKEDKASPVTGISSAAGPNLLVTAGRSVSFISSQGFKPFHCHREESGIASLTVESGANFAAFIGNHEGEIKFLRISRALTNVRNLAVNGTYCQVVNTRKLTNGTAVNVASLKGYLVVQGGDRVAIYNATRAINFAPWHVFDVPSNASGSAGSLLVATDKAESFALADPTGARLSLYHTGLPQLARDDNWEVPGRPYIFGGAILLVFGYQWFFRKSVPGGKEGNKYTEEPEGYVPSRHKAKQGYGKYGPPPGMRYDGNSGNKGSRGAGGGAGAGGPRLGKDMADIGSRTAAIEDRMADLQKMTSSLGTTLSKAQRVDGY